MTRFKFLCSTTFLTLLYFANCFDFDNEHGGECEVEEKASEEIKPCIFPFIYENNSYYGCTLDGPDVTTPWCSTQTDPLTHEHTPHIGAYGDCDDSCPSNEEGLAEFDYFAEQSNSLHHNESEALAAEERATSVYENCQCSSLQQCNWSKDQLNRIARLSSNSASRKGQIKYIRDRICDPKTRTVYCCRNQQPPRTTGHLKFLKALNSNPVSFGGGSSSRPKSKPTPRPRPSRPSRPKPTPKPTPRPRPSSSSRNDDKNSGLWKPNPDKGQCGHRTIVSNIVGGEITKLGDFPYMALLGYEVFNRIYYTCGGALINKWYVLTAAHCVGPDTQGPLSEILLGEHTVGQDPDCKRGRRQCAPRVIKRKIGKVIRHTGFGGPPNYRNDIALVRLKEAVPLYEEDSSRSAVVPVCLPWNSDDPGRDLVDGDRMIVTGWGRVTNNKIKALTDLNRYSASTRTLRKLTVRHANNKCTNTDAFNIDENKQMCAGGRVGKDSCNGDSGGPIAYREFSDDPWYQVGIVSYGTSKCGQGEPGVYTKVDGYLDWIEEHLEP